MSEINNISKLSGKVEKIQASFKGQTEKTPAPDEILEEKCEAPNCDIPQASGILGKSMVRKPDSVASDVEAFLKNPDAVKSAVDFSDTAYDALMAQGVEHPYENSALLMGAYGKEFQPG